MPDLSITAASVVTVAGGTYETVPAGVSITAGQTVYKDTTPKLQLSDSDSATAAVRVCDGIALNAAAANQPVRIQKTGDVTIGATLVPGTIYVLSDTPGGIMPYSDLEEADYVFIVGYAISTTVLRLLLTNVGVAVPPP